MIRATAACVLALAAAGPATAQPQKSVDALRQWTEAVRKHQPGTPDAAAAQVASWSYAHRVKLNPAMERFFTMLRVEPVGRQTPQQQEILALVRQARNDAGIPAFIRRAAILHTDAAVFAADLPEPPDDAPAAPLVEAGAAARSMRLGHDASALLSADRYVLHLDGRVIGEMPANWHWGFARLLLDEILTTDRAFVADWYHAISAYMLANGRYGDLRKHMRRAAIALPDDPHVLFDSACVAEGLGLPFYQALVDDPGYRHSTGRLVAVPPADATAVDAEHLFRQTLAIDPSYLEARVRLARLLDRRGRHDEAASEVENVLEHSPAGAVGFYARIVAGRVALAQGRFEAALRHYRAASAIFPRAQSALLGASHASVMLGDVPQALAPLGRLGGEAAAFDADPWWDYQIGAGRDADALMASVWDRIPKS